jgi:hypothetical protein
MEEVGFKEYHDDLGVSRYLVLKWSDKHFSFTLLNSLISYVALSTQDQDFIKGRIEVYRTLVDELLPFHQHK